VPGFGGELNKIYALQRVQRHGSGRCVDAALRGGEVQWPLSQGPARRRHGVKRRVREYRQSLLLHGQPCQLATTANHEGRKITKGMLS
jgi:hypothetical protein